MKTTVAAGAAWAVALALGLLSPKDYFVNVATTAAIFAVWGQSWNILSGLSGNISLGHSAFIAVAAYTTVILFKHFGVPPAFGWVAGVAAAVGLAAIIGAATLRLRGPYFTLATLSVAAVVLQLLLRFKDLTGGASGLAITFARDNPLALEFTNVRAYYALAITLLFAVTMIVAAVRRSKLGYYILAIQSSEEAAAAAGVRVARVKVAAFCLSAALTAIGGVLFAFFLGFADPNHLSGLTLSVEIALIAVVGGSGYLIGPIAGAIFYELIDVSANAFAGASGGWDTMILGFAVVAVVMLEPRGLVALALRAAGRRPEGAAAPGR